MTSQLPWKFEDRGDGVGQIRTSSRYFIAMDVSKANAAFIVRACNSHEKLVEALKQVLKTKNDKNWVMSDIYNQVEQALQSAEGK